MRIANTHPTNTARLGRSRFFSRIRKKIKRAIESAVRSLIRGITDLVKKLFEPITKFLTKIWDFIEGMIRFVVKLVRMIPKLFTPDLPKISNVINSFLTAIRRIVELVALMLKWVWKWITWVGRDIGSWLYRAFPETDWRNVDNVFGSAAVWPVCTAGMTHSAPKFLPAVSRPMTGNFFESFRPTSLSNVLGHANAYKVTTYPYRIVVPFVSGLVAVVVVSPIWLVNLVIGAPQFVVDVATSTVEAVGGMAYDLITELADIIGDLLKEWWHELTKPFRYYLDLIRDLVR